MSSSSYNNYEIIVIGLGAAGAAAVSVLAKAGKRVLALEAQDYIGGRVHSVPFGDGVIELGAEWIHGEKNNLVYEQAMNYNIKVVPQGVDLVTYRSDGSKPEKNIQDLINTLVEQQQCDEMVLPEEPGPFGEFVAKHIKQVIKDKDPQVLQDSDFMEQLVDFINLLVNNHNASNDWNDIDAHDKYTALEGNLYLSWHKYGFKTFFDILLNKFNHGAGFPSLDVKLHMEVTQIDCPQEPHEKITVLCKNGEIYFADFVIITVSIGVLKEMQQTLFKPNLPEKKYKAIERTAIGVMDKIELSFDKIWWPLETQYFGFLWKGEDKRKVSDEHYWTTRIFAASRPMGAKNVLTLWTSGNVAKLIEKLPEPEVKEKCRGLLQKFMGANITVPEPTGIIRSTWYLNRFTRGSYTYDSVACASYPTARADLAAPLLDSSGRPRVLFAGEATHETHFSTVHGAAETGIREAMRLLENAGCSKI